MKTSETSTVRQLWRILYPCLTYYLINIVVSLAFMAVTYVIAGRCGGDSARQSAEWMSLMQRCNYAMTMVMAVVAIPFCLHWLRRDWREGMARGTAVLCEKASLFTLIMVLVLGGAACILVNHTLAIGGLTQRYAEDLESVAGVLYQGNLIWELLGVGFLAPIAEELIFRGLTQRRMRESVSPWVAILVSSLLFAAMHGNFLQGIFAFCLGLLMGYSYERCRTLSAPILLHVGANLVSVIVSDTNWLAFIYESNAAFWGVTVGSAVLTIVGILYLAGCRPRRA